MSKRRKSNFDQPPTTVVGGNFGPDGVPSAVTAVIEKVKAANANSSQFSSNNASIYQPNPLLAMGVNLGMGGVDASGMGIPGANVADVQTKHARRVYLGGIARGTTNPELKSWIVDILSHALGPDVRGSFAPGRPPAAKLPFLGRNGP